MSTENELVSQSCAIEAIKDLARQIATPLEIHGVPHIAIPDGMTLHALPTLQPRPARIQGTIELHTAAAFIAYWQYFALPESVIFFDQSRATFTAIFDYHRTENPFDEAAASWCEHRAVYACPKTAEWELWESMSAKPMNQVEIAYFIEQNVDDIQAPAGAEMLEIVTTLKAKTKVEFNKVIRLSSGHNELTYNEVIEGAAGPTGNLRIPEEITLGIVPFQGSEAYAIKAKFRYRIKDCNLSMWFDLIRPHKVNEKALGDIAGTIRAAIGESGLMLDGKA